MFARVGGLIHADLARFQAIPERLGHDHSHCQGASYPNILVCSGCRNGGC